MEKLIGVYQGNQAGFGFVTIEGQEDDVFIPEKYTHNAIHKDTVEIVIKKGSAKGKRREGKIVKILEHEVSLVVGTFYRSKSFGFVVPDNKKLGNDIYIAGKNINGAVDGHKVQAKIIKYGDKEHKPEGAIVEIIGHINDPGTDIKSVVLAYELPVEFPEQVMEQVKNIPDSVTISETEGRIDIRNWQTVTIDGEDAKDLDDAITITKEENTYLLGVHIADVSHYVREGSPLDEEALKRGTSVYLVDRVIPMLPHKLSNGICSLNEGVDRLALSCIMKVDMDGNVIESNITETIINVDRRMTYTKVKNILENDEKDNLSPMFEDMRELSKILRKKRRSRGSIDFDLPETKVILNKRGVPVEIKPYDRNVATKIIEEFMLLANETIAENYFWQETPFVYRIHENPDSEKILRLSTFINNFGYSLKAGQGNIHPKELQKLLERIEGTDQEALITRLMLRSMKQARYSSVSGDHFGLAAKFYCHFTSPIRRYPDLQIHRIIKDSLNGKLSDSRLAHYSKILQGVSEQTSKTERRAEEAERETIKLKKVEYMEKHIGEEFEGVISGITGWGMYVELPNTVEGMVRISEMKDDFYVYDENRYELTGKNKNKKYKLGQKIKVLLIRTDKSLKTIDFEISDKE